MTAGVQRPRLQAAPVYSIDRVGNRTHRRILTVDGRSGFCGGVGIDDRWQGDARNPARVARHDGRDRGPRRRPAAARSSRRTGSTRPARSSTAIGSSPESPRRGALLAQASRPRERTRARWRNCSLYMAIQAARRKHLDRERLLRSGQPDPRGLDRTPSRRGRGRAGHRSRGAHRHPDRPRWLRGTTTASSWTAASRSTSTSRR